MVKTKNRRFDKNGEPLDGFLYRLTYNSLDEMIADAVPMSPGSKSAKTETDPAMIRWRGTKTWEEALERAKNGVKDPAFSAERMQAELTVYRPIDRFRWQKEGLDFDVGLMMTENPDHWIQPIQRTEPTKMVKIGLHVGVTGAISGEFFAESLFQAAKLALSLDASGSHNVQLDGIRLSQGAYPHTDCYSLITWPIKPFSQTLDTQRLRGVADVSFHRRIIFALMENQSPDYIKRFGAGKSYGSSIHPKKADCPEYDRWDWVFDCMNPLPTLEELHNA